MSVAPVIECMPNGPYVVRNPGELRNRHGSIAVKSVIALCRCGGSSNKPFCDGTHQRIGFSDEKRADRTPDRLDSYRGAQLAIHDNRGLCAHAGYCTDRLPAVFRSGVEPWINPQAASADAIIATIHLCPSGALGYSREQREAHEAVRTPAIMVSKDGPYEVVGGIELIGQAWNEGASREHYTLCRCGGSRNKPFCDGTHWSISFSDGEN